MPSSRSQLPALVELERLPAVYPPPYSLADEEPEEAKIPLSQYLWILKRYRFRILAFIAFAVISTVIISARLTPIYESTATIDIDRQAPPAVVGQDSTHGALNDADQFLATQIKLVQLVLQAAAMGAGGEIFVLEMGEPLRIVELARKLVLLSGLIPDVDVRIEFSGIRPGEKLFEELSREGEHTVPTRHPQVRIFSQATSRESIEITRGIEQLRRSVEHRDAAGVLQCFEDLIPDYQPSAFLLGRTRNAASAIA
jgi:hypothetical protein